MTIEQRMACEKIIKRDSMAAGVMATGAGYGRPGTGMNIMPIQISMAISLGKIFGVAITQSMARGLCMSVASLIEITSFQDSIPVWISMNGITRMTEKMGWKLAEKFDRECR